MNGILHYGSHGALDVVLGPDAVLVDYTEPRGDPLDDPVAAVAAALLHPLDFPPLTQATVPGDRIALALEGAVPQAPAVVAAVVHMLVEGHAEPSDITLVIAPGDNSPTDPTAMLRDSIRDDITIEQHDPGNTSGISFLASSREGHRVCINRTLFDADVVLPIGILRLPDSLGYFGVHSCLFPTFSDEATIQRFRSSGSQQWQVHQRRRREEVEEAAWLLGVQLTIQIAPGRGDEILHVLAGESRSVDRRGRELCSDAWLHHSPDRAGLVLASIEGGAEHQTWENFARALYSASNAVRPGGAIVLCTELELSPGPALSRLASGDDDEALLRHILRDKSPDAIAALQLLDARRNANIYLLSGIDRDTVEELGMGYVAGPQEVENLTHQFDSCILLGNAHQALLETAERAL